MKSSILVIVLLAIAPIGNSLQAQEVCSEVIAISDSTSAESISTSGVDRQDPLTTEGVPLLFPIYGLSEHTKSVLARTFEFGSQPETWVHNVRKLSLRTLRALSSHEKGRGPNFFNYNQHGVYDLYGVHTGQKRQIQYVQPLDAFDKRLLVAAMQANGGPRESFGVKIHTKTGEVFYSDIRLGEQFEISFRDQVQQLKELSESIALGLLNDSSKPTLASIVAIEMLHVHPIEPYFVFVRSGRDQFQSYDLSAPDIESSGEFSKILNYPVVVTAISAGGFKYSMAHNNGRLVTEHIESYLFPNTDTNQKKKWLRWPFSNLFRTK